MGWPRTRCCMVTCVRRGAKDGVHIGMLSRAGCWGRSSVRMVVPAVCVLQGAARCLNQGCLRAIECRYLKAGHPYVFCCCCCYAVVVAAASFVEVQDSSVVDPSVGSTTPHERENLLATGAVNSGSWGGWACGSAETSHIPPPMACMSARAFLLSHTLLQRPPPQQRRCRLDRRRCCRWRRTRVAKCTCPQSAHGELPPSSRSLWEAARPGNPVRTHRTQNRERVMNGWEAGRPPSNPAYAQNRTHVMNQWHLKLS